MSILFKDEKDDNEKNKNKILILTVFVILNYYSIRWYKKILYKPLSLSRNSYVIKLLLQNHFWQI